MKTKTSKAPAIQEAFATQILADFTTAGVPQQENPHGEKVFTLETVGGILTCKMDHVRQFQHLSSKLLTLFGRFADPQRAAQVTDCNPHSGKWNFHRDAPTTATEAQGVASYFVQRVLSLKA